MTDQPQTAEELAAAEKAKAEKVAKMMGRISALLAKAESTTFKEEADTYRLKAEELMRIYRIEEESLLRESTGGSEPVWRQIRLYSQTEAWADTLNPMFWDIARHCGVEGITDYLQVEGSWQWVADVVGFEIDLRLLEMIFASARLAFLARLEPDFDPALSTEENIYRLRGSGMDRQRVARLVFGQEGHSQGIRVGQIYKAECERRGETDAVSGRGFNAAAYREAYADAFRTTIRVRLRNARDAADSHGGALVLPERAKRVKEALYAKFPFLRPETPEERAERQAKAAAREAAMTPAERKQREKEQAAISRRSRWTQADERRWNRVHGEAGSRARAAGSEAAASVDLVREAPKAQRAERAERAGELGA